MSDKDEPEHLNAGRGLRLIKTPETKRPEPNSELKAMLDDMCRRYRVSREWVERAPGGNDAA